MQPITVGKPRQIDCKRLKKRLPSAREGELVAGRCNLAAKSYYQRLRRKKRAHVARVARARKLLVAVWAMLHHGVAFDQSVFAAG